MEPKPVRGSRIAECCDSSAAQAPLKFPPPVIRLRTNTSYDGTPFADAKFAEVRRTLTKQFGGCTAFTRAPAEGVFREDGKDVHDDIIILEVMAETLDRKQWGLYRTHLEREFAQEEIYHSRHSHRASVADWVRHAIEYRALFRERWLLRNTLLAHRGVKTGSIWTPGARIRECMAVGEAGYRKAGQHTGRHAFRSPPRSNGPWSIRAAGHQQSVTPSGRFASGLAGFPEPVEL